VDLIASCRKSCISTESGGGTEIDKCSGNHNNGWNVLEKKGKHIQNGWNVWEKKVQHIQLFSQKYHFDL